MRSANTGIRRLLHVELCPIHPSDLWSQKVVPSYREEVARREQGTRFTTDGDKAILSGWVASLAAFGNEVQREALQAVWNRRGAMGLKRAYLIPPIRSERVYQTLFLEREGCAPPHALPEMNIEGAGNVFLLDARLQSYWEDRQLFFLPYPNAGWLAPGKPRPLSQPAEVAGRQQRQVGPRRVVELPAAEKLQLYFRTREAKFFVDATRITDIPRPAVGDLPEAFRPQIKAPAAAFLYSSMAYIGSQLISGELRETISDLIDPVLWRDYISCPPSSDGEDEPEEYDEEYDEEGEQGPTLSALPTSVYDTDTGGLLFVSADDW